MTQIKLNLFEITFHYEDLNEVVQNGIVIGIDENEVSVTGNQIKAEIEKKNFILTNVQDNLTVEDVYRLVFPLSWADIRASRDSKLLETDWTQLPDVPLTAGEQGLWKLYRQELRDITSAYINPEDVVWPSKPFNQGEIR